MKSYRINLSTIIFLLIELIVGIKLLVNPEGFARAVITFLGIVSLAVGIICLIRCLRAKQNNMNSTPLLIFVTAISLIFGIICTFFSGAIIGAIAIIAVIYGVALAISGIYKLNIYFEAKRAAIPVSKTVLSSGVVAIVLGLVIIVYPKTAAFSVWQLGGIMLIVEAAIDLLSLIQLIRIGKTMM